MNLIDRLLLQLRLARARTRGNFRPESDFGAPVIARGFDLDFPEGEAAYNAIGESADGRVWFAIGSKRHDTGARLFSFDPATSSVRAVAGLDDALASPGVRAIPQGKVHVDLIPHGKAMLGATHIGVYDPRSAIEQPAVVPGYEPYPGGWFFAIEDDRVVPLAQAPAGEGIITMSADLERSTLFALTWPRGLFLTLDLASRSMHDHGPVCGLGETGSKRDGTWSRICRSIGVDPRTGAAFWSDDAGRIFRFNGRAVSIVAATPRRMIWRKVFWHPREHVFYGWLWQSPAMFRFDPDTLACGEVCELPVFAAPATLAFALHAHTNTIHALVTGPGVLRRGKRQLATSVFHLTHDLDDGMTRLRGPLRLADERWVTQSQSLLIRDHHAYSLCWVEVPVDDRSLRARAILRLRRDTLEYRTRGYAEEMMFVRFDLNHGAASGPSIART